MRKNAKSERLSYVTEIYLRSQREAIWGSVRFVIYRYRLISKNLGSCHAAAKQFAMDAI
jgi:hypothetical protein